jgi:hypothetical protein
VNRRQRQPWEQDALAELHEGSVARAVEICLRHGRVIVADNPHAIADLRQLTSSPSGSRTFAGFTFG